MKLLIIAITLIIGILMITTVVSADSFTFSGTSVFDAGTKINVETISDACHIQPSANQFGLNGIGRYAGVSSNCMSGTKEFQNSIQSSYDFQTLRSSKLQDFVASADCSIVNSPTSTNAYYNGGYIFASGSSQYMNCPSAAPTTTSWSVFMVVKPGTSGAKVLLSLDTSASASIFLTYGQNCNLGADSGVLHACQTNTNDASATITSTIFYNITWVKNAVNATHNLYINGGWVSKSSSVNGGTTDINICKWVNALPDYCDSTFDELSIWNRVLNDTEISHLSTDGRSLYQSSGNWLSANQTYIGQSIAFNSVFILWNPSATSSRYISNVTILDISNNVIANNLTSVQSGTSSFYFFANSPSTASTLWKLRINLTGDGLSTINPSQITVDFTITNVAIQFGNYGWALGFMGALILGLIGAYKIKKWREER